MKRIGLIACSASKKGKDNPEQLFKAQDIYTGRTFLLSKNVGLKKFNCDDWDILSAEHKLLDKNKEIHYYDRYLHNEPADYKHCWVQTVIESLKAKYDLSQDVFYIFGGSDYYKGLLSYLHCYVFKFNKDRVINLNAITEYLYGKKCSVENITDIKTTEE